MDEDDDEEDDGQAKAKAKDGQPAKPVAGLNTPGMPCKVFTESTFSVSFLRSTSVIRRIKKILWINGSPHQELNRILRTITRNFLI